MKKNFLGVVVGIFLAMLILTGCQNPIEPPRTVDQGNPITEHGGPFSMLRHQYTDRALEHLYSNNPVLAARVLQPLWGLTLREKYALLKEGITQARSVGANPDPANDPYYRELSEEMLAQTDGFITISAAPLELSPESLNTINTPFIQEFRGVNYSKLELLNMAEQAAAGQTSGISRGITCMATPKWGSTIEYRFESNVTTEARNNMRSAMNEWQTYANGTFTFVEIEDNFWNALMWVLGFYEHLKIYQSSTTGIGGSATVGHCIWNTIELVGKCRIECAGMN